MYTGIKYLNIVMARAPPLIWLVASNIFLSFKILCINVHMFINLTDLSYCSFIFCIGLYGTYPIIDVVEPVFMQLKANLLELFLIDLIKLSILISFEIIIHIISNSLRLTKRLVFYVLRNFKRSIQYSYNYSLQPYNKHLKITNKLRHIDNNLITRNHQLK